MPSWIIITGLIVAVFATVSFLMRKSTLDHVVYDADEPILHKVTGVRVESGSAGPERVMFPNCDIIITRKKVIIAQKMLLSKKYQVRYILHTMEDPSRKNFTLEKGVVNLKLRREKIRPVREDGDKYLRMIPEAGEDIMTISDIIIMTEDPETLVDIILSA